MELSNYNLAISAIFDGRKGNRPPAVNPTAIACHDLMDAVHVSFPQAHIEANAMAELALAGHELIGYNTVMPEFIVEQEDATLGSAVDWSFRNRMPDTTFLDEDFPDVVFPDIFLETPSMRVLLDAFSILHFHVAGRAASTARSWDPGRFPVIWRESRTSCYRSVWMKKKRSGRC